MLELSQGAAGTQMPASRNRGRFVYIQCSD